MMSRLAALCVACLAIPQSAFADRFYFGSAEAEKKMAAGTADFIEGVLLRRENGNYVIRIKGGEISVPEASIYKIENDALTAEAIVDSEKADADRLARANELRRERRAAADEQRREAADARRDAERAELAAANAQAVTVLPPAYDVILGLYNTLYPPSTPVTPLRVDRGMSWYIDAQEYRDQTGH